MDEAAIERLAAKKKAIDRWAIGVLVASVPLSIAVGYLRYLAGAETDSSQGWGTISLTCLVDSIMDTVVAGILVAAFFGYFSEGRRPLLRSYVHLLGAIAVVVLWAFLFASRAIH